MQINEWKKYPATQSIVGAYDVDFICQYPLNGFSSDFAFEPFKMGAISGAFVQYSPLNLLCLVTPILCI